MYSSSVIENGVTRSSSPTFVRKKYSPVVGSNSMPELTPLGSGTSIGYFSSIDSDVISDVFLTP